MARNKRIKLKKLPLTVLLLLTALGLIISGVTAARYVVKAATDTEVAQAEKAYFTSDKLHQDGDLLYRLAVPSAAAAEISFELRNSADEIRISEADINYTVTSSVTPYDFTNNTGTLTKVDASNTVSKAAVTLKGFNQSIFDVATNVAYVKVTAASKPYSTTLAATFELYLPIEGLEYTVYDAEGTSALTMILTTGSKGGTVIITCPENVYPDRTNTNLNINATDRTCTFVALPDAEYSLTFFKSDPSQTYTDSFTVNDNALKTTPSA